MLLEWGEDMVDDIEGTIEKLVPKISRLTQGTEGILGFVMHQRLEIRVADSRLRGTKSDERSPDQYHQ
ncbi:hypothetical protein Y032_0209g2109 [Ancylostoma ceylanicum]|uniref:Uncharacterized protein n=1 Tax=Ancylostoma ceylanicum TaxID=53326 RepID=A0A016SKP9_9BILA|nr:hypothetical protein Y032_0209g2109 [Ancylostoma ceylanicum]